MAQGKSETTSSAPDVLQVQHQIRANAAELQDYFADLYSWEKSIAQEEAARKQAAESGSPQSLPEPRKQRASVVASSLTPPSTAPVMKSADAHTYDKGYKKWEKFDVDAALQEADGEHGEKSAAETPKPPQAGPARKVVVTKSTSSIPAKPREEIEREEGNDHYKRGDYVAAIKSYTRALGFNSRNVVVLSNRAMAYLKNKEYTKAEDDCTLALKIDNSHVKSYSRRGTARNSLGKHRLALSDFERALELDPKSKQTASQIAATKDLMRTAIKRAPSRTNFAIKVIGETFKNNSQDDEELVDKENKSTVANNKVAVVSEEAASMKTAEPTAPQARPQAPSSPLRTSVSARDTTLPKLPKKAAQTSYEFLRIWKTLAPKGDYARVKKLQELRAAYLQMHQPRMLPTVFKNSIESELLCEMFTTIRHALDIGVLDEAFALDFVTHLARVPRFSMVAMFLSDKEKTGIAWVIDHLAESGEVPEDKPSEDKPSLVALRSQYGLK